MLGRLLPEGLLVLGVEALGLLPDGAAVPEGRLPLGVPLEGLLLLGLVVLEGVLQPPGCEETGLFSAKTGSLSTGLS